MSVSDSLDEEPLNVISEIYPPGVDRRRALRNAGMNIRLEDFTDEELSYRFGRRSSWLDEH